MSEDQNTSKTEEWQYDWRSFTRTKRVEFVDENGEHVVQETEEPIPAGELIQRFEQLYGGDDES